MRWTLVKSGLTLFTAGTLGVASSQAQLHTTSTRVTRTTGPAQAPYVSSGVISYEDTVTVTSGVITYEDMSKPPEPAALPVLAPAPVMPAKPVPPARIVVSVPPPPVPVAPEPITTASPKLMSSAAPSSVVAPVSKSKSEPPPVSHASAAPMHRSDPSCVRLQERIESACGGAAKNVEIRARSKNRLEITLQCASREHAERVAKQIVEMRELAQYDVALDLKVAP